MDDNKEFDVADFNKRLEMNYSATQYREDLRLNPVWVKTIEQTLSDETKMLMYKHLIITKRLLISLGTS